MQSQLDTQTQKCHLNTHTSFCQLYYIFFTQSVGSWQIKRAKGARVRGIGISWLRNRLVCAWVRGVIWLSRLTEGGSGNGGVTGWCQLLLRGDGVVRGHTVFGHEIVVKEDEKWSDSDKRDEERQREGDKGHLGVEEWVTESHRYSKKRRQDRKVVRRWWYEEKAEGERVGGVSSKLMAVC